MDVYYDNVDIYDSGLVSLTGETPSPSARVSPPIS